MTRVAIIACAGWKGAGRGTEFVHLPAPFLPLGDGTTAAGRLSAQMREMGYDVIVTAGPIGYPFRACQPRHEFRWENKTSEEAARILGLDPDASPWTEELHAYIRELGVIVIQPDPGWKTKHDSFYVALDYCGREYDEAVLLRGDKLYRTAFLEQVLTTLPWPCQFALDVYFSIFMLDRRGMALYRADAEHHRHRSRAAQNWGQEMAKQPDGGEGTGRLERAGIAHFGWHTPPWDVADRASLWADVDRPAGYEHAKQWIRSAG